MWLIITSDEFREPLRFDCVVGNFLMWLIITSDEFREPLRFDCVVGNFLMWLIITNDEFWEAPLSFECVGNFLMWLIITNDEFLEASHSFECVGSFLMWLIIPPGSTKLKAGYTGFSLAVYLWVKLYRLCTFHNTHQFWPWILSLPVSVCVCVCLSIHPSPSLSAWYLISCSSWDHQIWIRWIYRNIPLFYDLTLNNGWCKQQRCKRPWLRSLLFCGGIDLDLQGLI